MKLNRSEYLGNMTDYLFKINLKEKTAGLPECKTEGNILPKTITQASGFQHCISLLYRVSKKELVPFIFKLTANLVLELDESF